MTYIPRCSCDKFKKKIYYVEHEGDVTDSAIQKAKEGVLLKDGTVCKSAVIERLEEGKSTICIREGMYHQVKRIRIVNLPLADLKPSEVRELSEEEKKLLLDLVD